MHAPERPEQVLIGFAHVMADIVDETDESREAERAGHQRCFVVRLIAVLAYANDVGKRGVEFLLGQIRFTHKGVQVAYERRHDFAKSAIRRPLQLLQYRGGDVFFVFDDHAVPRGHSPSRQNSTAAGPNPRAWNTNSQPENGFRLSGFGA